MPNHPIRRITIEPALNGYLCTVGCQTLVFESRQSLLNALTTYLNDPLASEKRHLAEAVNCPMTDHVPTMNAPCSESQSPVDATIRAEPCVPPPLSLADRERR